MSTPFPTNFDIHIKDPHTKFDIQNKDPKQTSAYSKDPTQSAVSCSQLFAVSGKILLVCVFLMRCFFYVCFRFDRAASCSLLITIYCCCVFFLRGVYFIFAFDLTRPFPSHCCSPFFAMYRSPSFVVQCSSQFTIQHSAFIIIHHPSSPAIIHHTSSHGRCVS